MIFRSILAASILLAHAGPAVADPIITPIVTSVIGAALAETAIVGTLTVGGLITGAIELGLVTGASLLLAPKHKAIADPSRPQAPTMQSVSPQSISPRYYAAGRIMAGGVRHWYECEDAASTAGHLICGIILDCGPIDGIDAHLVDGENLTSYLTTSTTFQYLNSFHNGVVVNANVGTVQYPTSGLKYQFVYTQTYNVSTGQWVNYPIGNLPLIGFQFLNGQPGGNVSGLAKYFIPSLYGDDNKCCNLSQLFYVACGGQIIVNRMGAYPRAWPEVLTVFRAARIFDPRDPGQDFNNPATWIWSRNSILIIAWYMTHPDGGRIPYSKMKWDTWAAEANVCDAAVPIFGGGTEARFRTDCQWHTGEAVRDVMARLKAACDAEVWEDGDGLWNVWIVKHETPSVTLTDEDISSITIEEGNGALDEINYLTPSYMEPRENYQMIPAAPVIDTASVALVGERPQTIQLREIASFNQAHRIAYRVMKRQNPALRITITGKASLLRCIGEKVVSVQSAAANINGTFRFMKRASVSEGLHEISIPLSLVSANDYDDVVPPYDPVSPFETSSAPPPAASSVQAPDAPTLAQVDISGSQYIQATATVGGSAPTDASLVYHAEYREHGTTGAWLAMNTNISQWVRESDAAVTVGLTYDVHGWFVQNGMPSAMSAISMITIT
jgi:hypothetical protein